VFYGGPGGAPTVFQRNLFGTEAGERLALMWNAPGRGPVVSAAWPPRLRPTPNLGAGISETKEGVLTIEELKGSGSGFNGRYALMAAPAT